MPNQERLSEKVKVNLTEGECAQLRRVAKARNLPLGTCVRAIVADYLRSQLTRGETLLLEAVEELQANYLGVIQMSLSKQLSLATLNEMETRNRLRRRDLAQAFLSEVPAYDSAPEADEDDHEDEDDTEE